jgi:hypothetical protein
VVWELETSGRAFVSGAIKRLLQHFDEAIKKAQRRIVEPSGTPGICCKILILKFLNLGFNPPSLNTLVRPATLSSDTGWKPMLQYAVASPLRVQGYRCWDGSERSLESPENKEIFSLSPRRHPSPDRNAGALPPLVPARL